MANNSGIILILFLIVAIISYMVYLTLRLNSFTAKKSSETINSEKSIISILEEIQESSGRVFKKADNFSEITEELQKRISTCIQRVGISSADVFSSDDKTSDMALALLNSYGDGVVITFSKNNFIVKPIEKGQCHSKLSKEEEKAVDTALK